MPIDIDKATEWRCPQSDCGWVNSVRDEFKCSHNIPDNECMNCQHRVEDVTPYLGQVNPWYSAWEYAGGAEGSLIWQTMEVRRMHALVRIADPFQRYSLPCWHEMSATDYAIRSWQARRGATNGDIQTFR